MPPNGNGVDVSTAELLFRYRLKLVFRNQKCIRKWYQLKDLVAVWWMISSGFLRNTYVVYFSTNCTRQVHAFICSYRKRFIWKTVAMTDGRLFQDASCMKMHVVCHACHRRSLDVNKSNCFQEWFFILLIISATIMALHWNFLKMKKTNYIFCSVEWSLMTTQHVTIYWDVWCLDCW